MAISLQLDQQNSGNITDWPALKLPAQLSILSGEREIIRARVFRVDRGILQVSSSAAIRANASVELLIDGCTLRAEVVSCEQRRSDDFTLVLRRLYGAKGAIRSEPRIPVDLSAVLSSPDCDRMFARIVNMSQSGLGFELPAPLSVGTRVSLHFTSGIAFGEIRHCAAVGPIYTSGMRIEEFVVRHAQVSAHVKHWSSQSRSQTHLAQGFLTIGRRVLCFFTGHEYGWFTDLWDRPVLRCPRCARILSP